MSPLENKEERSEVGSMVGEDLRLCPRWKAQSPSFVDLAMRPSWNFVLSGSLMWMRGFVARYGGGNVDMLDPLFACSLWRGSGNM